MNNKSVLIIAASGTAQFARPVSLALNIPLLEIESSEYPNEELKLKIEDVADTTILFGSLSKPVNNRIMEYILAADGIKRMGCKKLVSVLSWYAYSKQDKVFLKGEPLSAKVIADMLQNAGVDELYTLDLHNPAITDYFKIPVTNMSARNLCIDYLHNKDLKNTLTVSPDKGSVNNSTLIAEALQLPLIHASKTRDLNSGEVTCTALDGDVSGKNVLVFDDMIATGSTLTKLAEYLHHKGAQKITVCCTHHLYVSQALPMLNNSAIDEIVVTNSINPPGEFNSAKLKILDISPIIVSHLSQYKLTDS